MKNFSVINQTDPQSAAAEAGETLNALLVENLKRPVLLMVSAGSSLAILDYVGQTALGPNLTVNVLDERFSTDPAINNFEQLQKTDFYALAFEAEASFFGTLPRPAETIEQLSARWEKNLRNWREENPDGIIFATLGIGPDGHTAGIASYSDDPKKFDQLFNRNEWVVAYDAMKKLMHGQRITTTLSFFKEIDVALAYACGQERKAKLDEVLAHKGKINQLPALGWYEIKEVKVYTDIKTNS